MKTTRQQSAILLAVFGASNLMGQKALKDFEEQVRLHFADMPVRWAFTSAMLRRRLAADGTKSDSVEKALSRMGFEKFTRVAVQPLHLIHGLEFESVLEECRRAAHGAGPGRVRVGHPLLRSDNDALRAADALFTHLPPDRHPEDAVLYVGHGSRHAARSGYAALAEKLRLRDPRIFIDTLADDPASSVAQVKDSGASRVWLLPLLALIGKHAQTDIAGDGPESRRSLLEAAGLTCLPVLRGTLEYKGFADLWLERLEAAVAGLINEQATPSEEYVACDSAE